MEIQSVFWIANREWENISVSLESCGDIGGLDFVHYIKTKPELIRNVIGMEGNVHIHDYLSREAAYVFAELGSEAGLRLGLNLFGMGSLEPSMRNRGIVDPLSIKLPQKDSRTAIYTLKI